MFHKVLVGIDGHAGGLDAAALARQLVAPGGELVLANIDAGYPIAVKGVSGGYERLLHVDSRAVLEQACTQTGIHSQVSYAATTVGRGLHELAERESADLVVVGATRRGPAARIFIGDDTRETLKAVRGSVAVAVAPAGYADRPAAIGRIGLAYDGSSESRAAATVARDLAMAMNAELVTTEVVDIPAYLLHPVKPPDTTPAARPINAVTNQVAALAGSAPHLSAEEADEQMLHAGGTVDLLVMGSRSVGPVTRLLHGGTHEELVRRAGCAVLVVAEADDRARHSHDHTDQPAAIDSQWRARTPDGEEGS